MRIHAVFAVFLLSTLAVASGPDILEPENLGSTSTVDTVQGRIQSLVPLDNMITPADQARIDANRAADVAALERLVRGGTHRSRVDLRSRDTAVKKQFGGTCTAFGLTAAMENLMGGSIELSPRHFWSQYRRYSCAAAIGTASTSWGIVEMKWWPSQYRYPFNGYDEQPWYKLARYEFLDASVAKAVLSLNAGNPVYIGFATPSDMMNCPAEVDGNSLRHRKSGHAVSIVGYKLDPAIPGGGSFLMKNSWGDKCGEQGYQWFPFSLCTRRNMYCLFWSIQEASHD